MIRIPKPNRKIGSYWKMNTESFCLESIEVAYINEKMRARKWKPEIMYVNYKSWRWISKVVEIDLDEDDIYLCDIVTGQLFQKGVCMSNKNMTLEA